MSGTLRDWITQHGCDDDYRPAAAVPTASTDARPGSPDKLAVLAQRIRDGEPLWHPDDPRDLAGCVGLPYVPAMSRRRARRIAQ